MVMATERSPTQADPPSPVQGSTTIARPGDIGAGGAVRDGEQNGGEVRIVGARPSSTDDGVTSPESITSGPVATGAELLPILRAFRLLAVGGLVIAVAIHLAYPSRVHWALEAMVLADLLAVVALERRARLMSASAVAERLFLVQCLTAALITLYESWALHLTPLAVVAALAVAVRHSTTGRYRRQALIALALITVLAVVARRLAPDGPVHGAVPKEVRDVVAIVVTPALASVVAWVAWRNQGAMVTARQLVDGSRQRIVDAERQARRRFAVGSAQVRERLHTVQASLGSMPKAELPQAVEEVGSIATDLRRLARSLDATTHTLDDEDSLAALATRVPQPVSIDVRELGPRDQLVDSVGWDALTELLMVRPLPTETSLGLRRRGDIIDLTVDHTGAAMGSDALSMANADRLAAIGGQLWIDGPSGTARVTMPATTSTNHDPKSRVATGPTRSLSADLRPGLVLPFVGLALVIGLWLTALRDSEMLVVAGLMTMFFALPCVIAVRIAARFPTAALVLFAAAHWVSAVLVTDRLNVLKYFVAQALLVPLLIALPHAGRWLYTSLTLVTAVMIAAAIAVARLGQQIQVASDSPTSLTSFVVIVMVPLSSAVVIGLLGRNHRVLTTAAAHAVTWRRRTVEAVDRATRSIERDLHDSTQQRVISAALRLQIAVATSTSTSGASAPADSAPGPAAETGVEENVERAVRELASAKRSIEELVGGRSPDDLVHLGLANALAVLAESSPRPVDLRIEPDLAVDELSESKTALIWYCCNEALTNCLKHAGEGVSATIELRRTDAGGLRFTVSDNGRGFDPHVDDGAGLRNLRERTAEGGGELTVSSTPGGGVIIDGTLPPDKG